MTASKYTFLAGESDVASYGRRQIGFCSIHNWLP